MQKTLKKTHRNQKGFTLIELLVVIAILGVLAAVVVPNVSKFIGSGDDAAADTELQNMQLSVSALMAAAGDTVIAGTDVGVSSNDFSAGAITCGAEDLSDYLQPATTEYWYTITAAGDVTQQLVAP